VAPLHEELPYRHGAQARRLVSERAKLVDVRSPAEYAGKQVDAGGRARVARPPRTRRDT